jgi:CubicO group peptidase (beta-lactamase class C family)
MRAPPPAFRFTISWRNNMRVLLSVLVALVLELPALSQTNAAKAGMDAARLARIPTRMKGFVEQGTIAGAVTLVQRHGALAHLEAVGWQDLEAKKPMRADSIFQIMSMTKPVTAVGIMILLEEGKLALSDPVEKHLPEFRGMWLIDSRDEKTRSLKRPSRPITIRDLLTHTSGMVPNPPEGLKELYTRMDHTLAEAVLAGSQHPLEFEPGTRWQYCNLGIATLGRIIEMVAGQPFETFLEERIFKPLGMKDSFIFPPAEKIGRISMVYRLEGGKLVRGGADILGGDPAQYRKGARFSGPEFGMYSTAQDLASLYQMMLNGGTHGGGRLLSRASVDLMTAVHTGDLPAGHSPGMGYGLAWAVMKDPLATLGLQSVGTYGHGGAFGTQGYIDPKKDMVYVFLIQRASGGGPDEWNAFRQVAASAVTE